jgi:hypothetical protein
MMNEMYSLIIIFKFHFCRSKKLIFFSSSFFGLVSSRDQKMNSLKEKRKFSYLKIKVHVFGLVG